jgi:hypothetical protein
MNKSNTPPIQRGRLQSAQRILEYGPSGVGKSSSVAPAENVIYIDAEGGTEHLDVPRFPRPTDYRQLDGYLDFLEHGEHAFQLLVLDTADWIEKLIVEEVCRAAHKESIEDFGYGKGWTAVLEAWSRLLARLDRLRVRGIHIVFLAHSTVRKFEQPDAAGSYDRFELKLSKGGSALLKEWCDAVLFTNFQTKVVEGADGKKRAVGGRERVLYTTHSAAYDAKNRHGLPETLPLSWESLAPLFPNLRTPAPPPPPPGPVTGEQVEKIKLYWTTLKKSDADRTKAFAWLGADAISGEEGWEDLSAAQAQRLIQLLQKKINEVGSATSGQIAQAGKEVLS